MNKKIYLIRHAKVDKAVMIEGEPIFLSKEGWEWSKKLPRLIGKEFSLILYDKVDKCEPYYNRCEKTVDFLEGYRKVFDKRQLQNELKLFLQDQNLDSILICFRSESFGKIHEIIKPEKFDNLNTNYHHIFIYEFSHSKKIEFREVK